MLKKMLMSLAVTALLALGVQQASANTVNGTVYFTGSDALAGNATPAQVLALPAGDLGATFSLPSTPLFVCAGPGSAQCPGQNTYTLGAFLGFGGASSFTFFNGHAATDSLAQTLFDFKGTVSVTNGDHFLAGHDDGLTLVIGALTVISEPAPTAFATTDRVYTGPTGNFPFELVYGECCNPPAILDVTLPLISTPEPATLLLLGLGLGVAGLGFRRRRKLS